MMNRCCGNGFSSAARPCPCSGTGLLGNNPRPVIAAAGCLTLLTVAVAWFAGLARESASGIAVRLLGK